jgi:hypothetical protein
MAHGFGASPDGPLGTVAQRLAARGLAAFAFDYRRFGASEGSPRQLLDVRLQLDDWAAALDYVRSREDVDPQRIGLWGSSLSGGQVLSVAAHDPSIAAAVSQVPFADGHSVARAAGVRHILRVLPAILRDWIAVSVGRGPYLIHTFGPPGDVAALSAKFRDLYEAIAENAPGWTNEIAARSLLELYRFRPIRLAGQVRCPLLVVVTYNDRIAPPAPAMRAANNLPYVELALLEARHLDLYVGEARDRALHTELEFFAHHIGRSSAEPGDFAGHPTTRPARATA